MSKVTINYSGNSISKTVPEGTKVSDILGDRNLQAVLGFGSNVEASIDGVKAEAAALLNGGDELELTTKANEKAA